jgi:hypothetical protein
MDTGIAGEAVTVSGGSFIPANVSRESRIEINRTVEKSTVEYLEALETELRKTEGYTKPVPTVTEKKELRSAAGRDCGYIHHDRKQGLGYLAEMTAGTENGIIAGVGCYPANRRESGIILKHIERQRWDNLAAMEKLGLDAGYDVGAVHRGLEIMGITGYASPRYMHNSPVKEGFACQPDEGSFRCTEGKQLLFSRLIFKKGTGFYRLYSMEPGACRGCAA